MKRLTSLLLASAIAAAGFFAPIVNARAENAEAEVGPEGDSVARRPPWFSQKVRVRVERVVLSRLDGTDSDGETGSGSPAGKRSADSDLRTFAWGTVGTHVLTSTDRMTIAIEVQNDSPFILKRFRASLLELDGPVEDQSKAEPVQNTFRTNVGAPTVIQVRYGDGLLAVCNEEIGRPLVVGLQRVSAGRGRVQLRVVVDTSNEELNPPPDALMRRPIYPNGRDEYRISLRFAAFREEGPRLVADIFARFAEAFPFRLAWRDRRPIGALFLSSAERTSAENPRGWFGDPSFDAGGSERFRQRLLEYARHSIEILKELNAQGVIVWDVEGQEYPHATSYLGDPRSLPAEQESAVDDFFRLLRDQGFRVGLTIRPQLAARLPYAHEVRQVAVEDPRQLLSEKIRYAKKRWGCTLFYVDSNGDPNWPLDALIFKALAEEYPDSLLIPEHETVLHYAYTAPYHQLREPIAETPEEVHAVYPSAFSVVDVADGLATDYRDRLSHAVAMGDVPLVRAWFHSRDGEVVRELSLHRKGDR